MVTFGEPLKHVITLCGQILVSRKLAIRDDPNIRLRCKTNVKNSCFTDENTPLCVHLNTSPVCTFKTSQCLRAPRAHMFQHVCALCQHTRGRFERTHGDVLNGHNGVFSVSHTTHRTHHTDHTPQHNTRHYTTRKQTETERDRKTAEEIQEKRRQE